MTGTAMLGCRWIGKSRFRATVLGLMVLVLVTSEHARADVVIVRSSDAAPYKQADAEFAKRLKYTDTKVRSVLVKELAETGIGSAISTKDTVVAIGTPAATWLHSQLPEGIQLVYCMVANPEEAGLLKGSPCWGVTMVVAEADEFKVISETLPSAKVVGILYHSDTPAGRQELQAFRDALPAGWQVEAVAVNDFSHVAAAIDALMGKHVDIVWTNSNSDVYDAAAVRELLLASLQNKIPLWGFSPQVVRAGALVGVGVDPESQAAQTCELIKSLQDNKVSIEKTQPPKEYQIAVNLVMADQLGIQISEELLKKAQFIFHAEN